MKLTGEAETVAVTTTDSTGNENIRMEVPM